MYLCFYIIISSYFHYSYSSGDIDNYISVSHIFIILIETAVVVLVVITVVARVDKTVEVCYTGGVMRMKNKNLETEAGRNTQERVALILITLPAFSYGGVR